MQDLQGHLPVIIAAAAFLAGLCGERLRAKLARQAWQKRRGEEVKEGILQDGSSFCHRPSRAASPSHGCGV